MARTIAFRLWLAALLCCTCVPLQAQEEQAAVEPGFSVLSAKSRLVDDVVRLDALFDLRFSRQLVDALQNGVALTLVIEIEITKERSYLWSTTIATLEQRYRIEYQPLTAQYVLDNLNSNITFQFPNLESLLAVLSSLSDFPLLDRALLEADANYDGAIQISVDRDSFPVPLRLMSYIADDWHLISEWFEWSLLP